MDNKVPEIKLDVKSIKVGYRPPIKVFKYALWVNGFSVLTDNWFIYIFYKILWKIKPPEMKCFHGAEIEEELLKALLKEIDPKYYIEPNK